MDDRKHPPPEAAPEAERHSLFDRIVKRGIESGIGAFSRSEDTVRGLIDGLKLPREAATVLLDQIDETKKGLYQVVAKEIRDFLQSTNFAGDFKKILTGLAFEVKMEVRFKNTEDEEGRTSLRPDVSGNVALKDRGRKSRRPPPPAGDAGDGPAGESDD